MRPRLLAAFLVVCAAAASAEAQRAVSAGHTELGLDLYYTSLRHYIPFSRGPAPYLRGKSELEVYEELAKRSLRPRELVLEASINPLPYLGTVIEDRANGLYQRAQATRNLNLIQAITQGFEEPWAVSAFLGDVVEYRSIQKDFISKNVAYSGYLASAGNFHILNSRLIADRWIEGEWKIKGDEMFKDKTMRWSFRAGARFNDNHDVTDTVYLSVRRTRLDFGSKGNVFLNNSGFEYTVHFSQKNGQPVRHYFYVEKEFPLPRRRQAFSLAAGFVWTDPYRKYSGSLAALAAERSPFQVVLRPNLRF